MKKRLHWLTALLLMLFSSNTAIADNSSVTIDGITYSNWTGNSAVVTGCSDTVTYAKIRSSVMINGYGYPVTQIVSLRDNNSDYYEASYNLITVDLPEGITSIGSRAFMNCKSLKSIILPSTLTSLGTEAFYGCASLDGLITIPSGITEIADYTFRNCQSLDSISIPEGISSIGRNVFESCKSLKSIILPSTLTSLGTEAFYGCASLDGLITIPSGITKIARSTFNGCQSLDSISIPEEISCIEDYAFQGCIELKYVNIESLESWCNINFNYPANQYSFTNPLQNAANLYLNDTLLTDIVIPNGITKVNNYLFIGCSSITSVTIPEGVTEIGSNAFYDCNSLSSVTFPNTLTKINNSAFRNCVSLANIVIPNSVTEIGASAFENCYSLANATLSTSITELKSSTFKQCSSLTAIEIPKGVKKIGERSLAGTSIRVLTIPESVDTIANDVFPSSMRKMVCERKTPPTLTAENGVTPNLGNIYIVYVPKGCRSNYITVYPWSSNRVIVDGSGIAVNVNVSPGMMGEEILKHTDYLSDVNFLILSGSVNETDINNLKNSMPNLLTIDMKDLNMKNIPSQLFANRKAILNVTLPKNTESIGGGAFYNCFNLESIELPEGLIRLENATYINNDYSNTGGCFSNCDMLMSISFPSTLTDIGSYAFSGCSNLTKLVFADGLKTISESAFQNCGGIKEITFNKNIKSIGSQAFYNCYSLQNLHFPESLKTISAGAFASCSSLHTIVFAEGITSIGYEYESSDNYNSGNYQGVFSNCSSLQHITLPNSLRNINQNTFSSCSKLTQIKIPEGVEFIGKNAFRGCTSLAKIELPSTLQRCSQTPFQGCSNLVKVNCMSIIPPILADGLLTLEDMGKPLQRVLSVPEWTVNRYKLSSGWAAFSQILPIPDVYPSSINVVGDAVLTLPDSLLPANYKPDMKITAPTNQSGNNNIYSSSLHLRGQGTLNLNKFTIQLTGYMGDTYNQLLTEAEVLADSIRAEMNIYNYSYDGNKSQWHFLCLPFDVKISEISTNSDWVVRKYDGKARANYEYNDTWVTVSYDSILHAGQGYIWSSSGGNFIIPAVDNDNKNNIFSNTTRKIGLEKHPAEFISNSGWNLVGNPFPCYYDSRLMDFTAPITVWDKSNNTYSAYSPVDDEYIFRPYEAFFVQCPADVDSIAFDPNGRQLNSTPVTRAKTRALPNESTRQVYNIVLSNDKFTDRTRLVINNKAKRGYELDCDAAKFMSNDAGIQQIYTIECGENLAINERPIDNGVIKLGTHFGQDGTYTIAMKSKSGLTAILVDKKNNVETDLSTGNYTFTAEPSDKERFEIRLLGNGQTTEIESVQPEPRISTSDNTIIVSTPESAKVDVYNASGSLVATSQGTNVAFNVVNGIYVVKVNGTSYKVVVGK